MIAVGIAGLLLNLMTTTTPDVVPLENTLGHASLAPKTRALTARSLSR